MPDLEIYDSTGDEAADDGDAIEPLTESGVVPADDTVVVSAAVIVGTGPRRPVGPSGTRPSVRGNARTGAAERTARVRRMIRPAANDIARDISADRRQLISR
jgi:hypothetical protein